MLLEANTDPLSQESGSGVLYYIRINPSRARLEMTGRNYMAGTQNKGHSGNSFLTFAVDQSKFYAHSHSDVDPPIPESTMF